MTFSNNSGFFDLTNSAIEDAFAIKIFALIPVGLVNNPPKLLKINLEKLKKN